MSAVHLLEEKRGKRKGGNDSWKLSLFATQASSGYESGLARC